MQRKYELKTLSLAVMKRAFQYLLLIAMLTACSSNQQCTTVGCEAIEQTKPFKKKKYKKPKTGLFPKKVFKTAKN
tara:strand:+ start:935 stop:1159 length:225 start_codon:yes stop_codon:yes gene_type:complete